MTRLHVRPFILGSYPIRGFIAWAEGDSDAVFVDPGGWDEAIMALLAEQELTVRAIVLTHGHPDHTEGLEDAVARLGAPVYIHAGDAHLLPRQPDITFDDSAEIRCGAVIWHALHVPGHTAGSTAFAAGDVVFTGDTLFAGAIGGTGTQDAYERERAAIRERLFSLGDATRVYPAHGPATTIGVERRCNPFLR